MNNKKLGTAFEQKVVKYFSEQWGYWTHFITPDARGAQPFDVIIAKDGKTHVMDCKTSSDHIFRISRLEWNQQMAFEKWQRCGNSKAWVIIEYKDSIYMITYDDLKEKKSIDLNMLIPLA